MCGGLQSVSGGWCELPLPGTPPAGCLATEVPNQFRAGYSGVPPGNNLSVPLCIPGYDPLPLLYGYAV